MRLLSFSALVAASLLAGCSFDPVVNLIHPYRIDVRQGNYVDQEMIAQLKKGMSRDQVRFVLGTPLVVDVFRRDRWDYVYLFKPGNKEAQERVVSVFFVDDRLAYVEGDVHAGDVTVATQTAQGERNRIVVVPEATKD